MEAEIGAMLSQSEEHREPPAGAGQDQFLRAFEESFLASCSFEHPANTLILDAGLQTVREFVSVGVSH